MTYIVHRKRYFSEKVSKYLHPLMFVNISSWIVNLYIYHNPLRALLNPTILLVLLLPGVFYIKREKARRNGVYNRGIAFITIMFGFFGAILIYILTRTPDVIIYNAVIAFVVIMIAMIINRFWWDISFHSAIPMCCVALLVPVSGGAALFVGLFALLVGLSRIPIRQHTVHQLFVVKQF
jgi:hypothetical protein